MLQAVLLLPFTRKFFHAVLIITCLLNISLEALFAGSQEVSPGNQIVCAEAKNSDIQSSLSYFDIGVGPLPIPIPNFGVGHRIQDNHHGADFSLKAATIVYVTQVKVNGLYHYYFTPNLQSQFYVGAGLGMSALLGHHDSFKRPRFCLSPEFAFGKQYINEANDVRFVQVEISWPTFSKKKSSDGAFKSHSTLYMPLVVVSYGICF